MKEYMMITPAESGFVVTVDRSPYVAASNQGAGMHAFHSIDRALQFIRKEITASKNAGPATKGTK